MRLLLDTHAFLWLRGDPDRLKQSTRDSLDDAGNEAFVSIVSLWEIALKGRVGKLHADVGELIAGLSPASKIQLLGVAPEHLTMLRNMPFFEQHRDPFDHLIIAQAIREDMILISLDRNAALYPVRLLSP